MKKSFLAKIMIVEPGRREIRFEQEESVLEVALKAGVGLNHSCGGMGTCTTCRIIVDNSVELPDRNEIEAEMATMKSFTAQERLACQLPPVAGLRFRIPN